MAKHSSDIMALARRGAEHRVKQLQEELAVIQKHFPDLVSHAGRLIKRGAVAAVATVGGVDAEEGGREEHGGRKTRQRKRNLSAAGRAAISRAAKRRWKKLRAAKAVK